MKKKNKRVIPGFGISMGVTLTMVSVIVLIPLATLVIYTAQMSFPEIIATITRGRVLSSFYVSFITAFAASAINAVMGLILAWVLVRYEFPGKRILDGMIELPFALPTAVAGISLTYLTTDSGWQLFCKVWHTDCLYQTGYHLCTDFRGNPICGAFYSAGA